MSALTSNALPLRKDRVLGRRRLEALGEAVGVVVRGGPYELHGGLEDTELQRHGHA